MANGKSFAPDMRLGRSWTPARSISVSPRIYQELKSTLHRDLLDLIDLEKLTSLEDVKARMQVQEVIHELMAKSNTPLSTSERERLSREVLHEVFGLGPLEPLLQDPTINDILVNTHKKVYVERGGVLEKTNVTFKDEAHLRHIIDKIVSNVGRRVDESSPMCDARLTDGSRVNVIIPPLAVDGPILSIRSEEHTSELQSLRHLVCRLLLEKKNRPNACTRSSGATCLAARSSPGGLQV